MLDKIKSLLSDYENALSRLHKAISSETDSDLIIDAVIQRFEFTFELSWKLMQSFLKFQGVICNSPRQTVKETFKLGLLEDGDAWIDMLMDRNKTSHIYDEQKAISIYDKIISKHVSHLNSFQNQIKSAIKNSTTEFNDSK